MERSGRLQIVSDVSSVGRALAIDGAGDALGAATQFVRARGFDDGDRVTVAGNDGELGQRDVFFMTSIRAQALAGLKAKPVGKKKGARKVGKKRKKAKKVKKAKEMKKATKPMARAAKKTK